MEAQHDFKAQLDAQQQQFMDNRGAHRNIILSLETELRKTAEKTERICSNATTSGGRSGTAHDGTVLVIGAWSSTISSKPSTS